MDCIKLKIENVVDHLASNPKKLAGIFTLGFLYWNRNTIRRKFNELLFIETTIKGTHSMESTANSYTEEFYFQLLKFINTLGNDMFQDRTVHINFERLNDTDSFELEVKQIPGYNLHNFWYKGCFFQLGREPDYLTLYTFKWNRSLLDDLLQVVRDKEKNRNKDKMSFYYADGTDWKALSSKTRRPLESVVIKQGMKEQLLKDVQDFLNSKEWYTERGIPYHRGYLLYGPPGSGKSSLIKAIAGAIKYDISILSLSSDGLTDDQLNISMNTVYSRSIILLEDIDAAFKRRDNHVFEDGEEPVAFAGVGSSKVTFKGLLNALDGVASAEGRIVMITTNHIKKLDPALIRPGRVDLKLLIDYPTEGQVIEMFKRFYKEAGDERANRFSKIVLGLKEKSSMASIQSLFIIHKNDAEEAIANAEEHLLEWVSSNNRDHLNIYT